MRRRLTAALHVRSATPKDAAAIAAVHVASWRVAYRGQLPDELLDSLSVEQRERWWGEGWWELEISRRTLLVAERDGVIVGFAATGPSRDDGAPPSVGEIYAIYAHPEAWGSGVGRRLMEHAADELRSARFAHATLWVLASNDRARRFYEIAGWQTDGAGRTEQLPRGTEAKEVRYRRPL